jgi:Alpha-glutamyl/putrescinyl thymine pyrophosphorylase clade 3
VRPSDQKRAKELETALVKFDSKVRPLPGVKNAQARSVLVEQMIDSLRRVKFAQFIRDEKFDPGREDPGKRIFDPLRAAVSQMRRGKYDEACWLVFLFVHFGKHHEDGWRLLRDIYGGLGGKPWTWERISANPQAFQRWLAANEGTLKNDGVSRRFGNHRKYESLSASSPAGTAAVLRSYVNWVAPPRTHQQLIKDAHKEVGQNPSEVFDYLYRGMSSVLRFGRLGKFDYLTMLGKLGLAPIEPGSAYLGEATGPRRGAQLLFRGSSKAKVSAKDLDAWLNELDEELGVGMQVLEDAICNWQKSPRRFIHFRG